MAEEIPSNSVTTSVANSTTSTQDNNLQDRGIANAANSSSSSSASLSYSSFVCDSQEGEDLIMAVAKLAPFGDVDSIKASNGDSLKICCYFVQKSAIDKNHTVYFKYGQDIQTISITNSVAFFGTIATVNLIDNSGNFASILEQQTDYYFVISILSITNEGVSSNSVIENGILYQPYIFDIDKIKVQTPSSSNSKLFTLELCDIISGTLKKMSYGNLLLSNPQFPNSQNFKEVYVSIIDYAIINIHLLHNKKYKYYQPLFLGGSINDSINTIIKDIVLKDVTIDTSLYTLMNRVFNMAGKEVEAPSNFTNAGGEIKGMLIMPLMLMDEWEDVNATYRNFYADHDDDEIGEAFAYSSANANILGNAVLFHRGYYFKNIFMPFEIAFGKESNSIYEIINPKKDNNGDLDSEEKAYNAMNGFSQSLIQESIEIAPDGNTSGIFWRNIALMSDGTGGGNNVLIYFNWIYNYFKYAFLNYNNFKIANSFNKNLEPVIDPYFHKMESYNLVGGDAETYAKMNARTVRMASSDPVKESLYYAGRALKSYIFLNSLFGVKLKGNIIRHPGEIIKFNSGLSLDEINNTTATLGGFWAATNGYALGYVTQVTHIFSGNEFNDIVYSSKFCEITDKEAEKEEESLMDKALNSIFNKSE